MSRRARWLTAAVALALLLCSALAVGHSLGVVRADTEAEDAPLAVSRGLRAWVLPAGS